MKLFGFDISFNINRAGPRAKAITSPVAPGFNPAAWLRGEDAGAEGGPCLNNAYEQVVWVYRAINVLAEQVANIPFLFSAGERGRERLITSGPLVDFYARPHPQLDRFQYWELRVMWLMLRGECFRVPLYEAAPGPGGRRLAGVVLLDPARCQHIVEDHRLIGWRYTGLGPQAPLASQVLLPEEVWHERLPNPFDFWRGLSPLQVAALAARTDFAAAAFMSGLIENNADNGLIVRSDKWLENEQRAEILASIRNRKRRAGVADRPVFLTGAAEIIKPGLSSSDLQFLENRKFTRSEICAAFGVPEEIVTSTEHNKYDVMTGARLNFIENRVAPLCSRLEAAELPTLRALDPRAAGWFDLDSLPIMQQARRTRLQAARAGFEMGVPFNELNRLLDLGFRPLPWGDRGYVSNALHEVDPASGRGAPLGRPSSDLPVSGRGAPLGRPAVACEPAGTEPLAVEDECPIARAQRLILDLAAPREPGEGGSAEHDSLPDAKPLLQRLRRFFFEQRGRALAALEESSFTYDPLPNASGAPTPAQVKQACLLDVNAEADALFAALRPALQAVREQALAGSARASGESTAAFIQSRQESLGRVMRGFLRVLQASVAQGMAAGESREDLAQRVRAVFNEAAHRGAPALARAEVSSSALV